MKQTQIIKLKFSNLGLHSIIKRSSVLSLIETNVSISMANNQLLRIEEELGSVSEYLGDNAFFSIR